MLEWCMSQRQAVTVLVRVRPGASRARVGGCYPGPRGDALIVAVTAPAVDGRATDAALRGLAEALGLRRAQVSLRRGATSRDKVFAVDDPPADLGARLSALLHAADPSGADQA
jgi:uncharacterized protein YggU (UPF0235/DUF167 family)